MDQKTGDNCDLYRPTNSSSRGIGSASRYALASHCPQPYWRVSHPAATTNPPPPQNSQFRTIQADLPCPADRETAFRLLRSFVSLSLHCSYPANFPQVLLRRAINLPYNRPASLFLLSAARTLSWKQASNFGACPNETIPSLPFEARECPLSYNDQLHPSCLNCQSYRRRPFPLALLI